MKTILTTLIALIAFCSSANASLKTKRISISYQCSFVMDGTSRHLIVANNGIALVVNPRDVRYNNGIEQIGWIGLVTIFPSGPGQFSRHISSHSPNRLDRLNIDTPRNCNANYGMASYCHRLIIKNIASGYGSRPVYDKFHNASCANYSNLPYDQRPQYQVTTTFVGTIMALGIEGWMRAP